jgi:Holliday junction resolvase RusA-like endonuclease
MRIDIKPLSVNKVWQGKRFKTPVYKKYERELMLKLDSNATVENGVPLEVRIDFGVSSKLSDIDNPLKPFLDVLQKKYGFDDRYIYRLIVDKTIVPKGKEYIEFSIDNYPDNV